MLTAAIPDVKILAVHLFATIWL